MKYRVSVLASAESDLIRNTDWWAEHHSLEQAERWYAFAHEALISLESNPQRHAKSAENQDFPYEIQDLLFGFGSRPSYRAIFTIQEDTVYVLAVHRGSQDRITPEQVAFEPDQ